MTAQEFEARIVAWARRQPDVAALVLAGSRAAGSGASDHWSDWDFHLISSRPERYHDTAWLSEIAPCWCAHTERTPRGVIKVSAVFAGGWEADFVPLAAWQMKLVYHAMRHPGWSGWLPRRLVRGIQETRGFMLGCGHRLLVGGADWEARFGALTAAWPGLTLTAEEFMYHHAAFWQKAVWVTKKIARPELRSAMHGLHLLVVNHVYPLLAEEARLAGCAPRSEARKAERWLDPQRLTQTDISTSLDRAALARALRAQLELFEQAARSVAESRGFKAADHSAVAAWLRTELAKLAD